jgi:ATP-binding cassette, subfamily B, bacterial
VSRLVHERVDGVQVVKVFGAESRETARVAEASAELRDVKIRLAILRLIFEGVLDVLPGIGNVVLLVVGAMRIRSGAMSPGEVLSFVYLYTLLVWPLRVVGWVLGDLPRSKIGYQRVLEVIGEPVTAHTAPLVRTGELRLDGVSFGYPPAADAAVAPGEVLHRLDAVLPVGRTTAIVGAVGSGKSTLLSLLAGLRAPTTGTVTVPSSDVALVFQEPFLFGDSLRTNITLDAAAAGAAAKDDAPVWAALSLAQADRFVRELPEMLDTVVGERGVTLSGGQRQRIALARALVRQPDVLLLDDTTAALDPVTEARVLQGLRTSLDGATVVMVASRPSTIGLADEVLFMAEGRAVAQGSHERLLADVPAYRTLIDAYARERDGDAPTPDDGGADRPAPDEVAP